MNQRLWSFLSIKPWEEGKTVLGWRTQGPATIRTTTWCLHQGNRPLPCHAQIPRQTSRDILRCSKWFGKPFWKIGMCRQNWWVNSNSFTANIKEPGALNCLLLMWRYEQSCLTLFHYKLVIAHSQHEKLEKEKNKKVDGGKKMTLMPMPTINILPLFPSSLFSMQFLFSSFIEIRSTHNTVSNNDLIYVHIAKWLLQ